MKKKLSATLMIMAIVATMGAQDLASVQIVSNNVSDDQSMGFSLIPIATLEKEEEQSSPCGIYLLDQTNEPVVQLECKNVAYDKNNFSATLMAIIKPILLVGGDIMEIPKVREWMTKLDNMFIGSDYILGITALMANGNINSERLLIQGEHSSVVIPQSMTNNQSFSFCLDGTPSDDVATTYFKEMAKHSENVKCIKLKSKKGGYRSFPKGLKFEAFGVTVVKNKKGGKVIDFEVTAHEGDNYEVRFTKPLEKGDYCFMCNDPNKDLFEGQLLVYDFTVE